MLILLAVSLTSAILPQAVQPPRTPRSASIRAMEPEPESTSRTRSMGPEVNGPGARKKRSSPQNESAPNTILGLPDAVLLLMLDLAYNRVSATLDGGSGERESGLSASDLGRLVQTSTHFSRAVVAEGSGRFSGRLMEKLAHDCFKERERTRASRRRADCGERVAKKSDETWLKALWRLDRFDRVPLGFSTPPNSYFWTCEDNPDTDDSSAPGRLAVGEVRAAGGAGPCTVVTGAHHKSGRPVHRMHCGLHCASITLVDPGSGGGALRVGIVRGDYNTVENDDPVSGTQLGWLWDSTGIVIRGELGTPLWTTRFDNPLEKWGSKGDQLGLELDCDRGILTHAY